MEIREIIELMKAASENGLTGFELEQGDTKIVMKREKKQIVKVVSGLAAGTAEAAGAVFGAADGACVGSAGIAGGAGVPGTLGAGMIGAAGMPGTAGMAGVAGMAGAADMSGAAGADMAKPEGVSADNVVISPLVGTFYSSPAPDADNFVKVGDHVKKGQVIGIVEAMKLMNEIESEYDGVVEAILVKNEETVEYGQPLFRIR